ncbi:hypothetical protein XENTR_v10009172 [Xenopus tropicalis]|nr:hypothetical protein XENTR_v10009172 [Xenopus tropicalis]
MKFPSYTGLYVTFYRQCGIYRELLRDYIAQCTKECLDLGGGTLLIHQNLALYHMGHKCKGVKRKLS